MQRNALFVFFLRTQLVRTSCDREDNNLYVQVIIPFISADLKIVQKNALKAQIINSEQVDK